MDFYKRVVNSIDSPMYVTDTEGTIVCVNPAFERLTGYEEQEVLGRKTSILKSGEMPNTYYNRLWDFILAGKSWKEEIINKRKDGSLYTVLQSISPVQDDNGDVQYFTAVQYDITREKELQDERSIFFNVSIDLFCIIDKRGLFKQLNTAWEQYLGQKDSELTGTRLLGIVHPEDRSTFSDILNLAVEGKDVFSLDARIITEDGGYRWVSWRIYYYPDKELYYTSGRDIQKRVEMEQEIRRISMTDKLTGIYNRLQYDERIKVETARAQRNSTSLSLILFDIDHFKQVNDTYGHQRGDHVLIRLVDVVKEQVREYDFLARWGGEEFLILSSETGKKDAYSLAERIRQSVESFLFEEVGHVTISLGISLFDSGKDTEESLLQKADQALYKAKAQGRNRTIVSE
ncbi:MAG TPA: diguanylate cyclase [Clostridia bacterium]|nr:diguanylate cyclase [Clostridia bacterium]